MCAKELKNKKGQEGGGTMKKQEEEASVVSFSLRGRKDMYLSQKEIKMKSENGKNRFPALFSCVLQVPLRNLSKSAT